MSGLFRAFLEQTETGGVVEFGYPFWLGLVIASVCGLLLLGTAVWATRSKRVGGFALLFALALTWFLAPLPFVQSATVRANQFEVQRWLGSSYEMQLRSLQQYRSAVRVFIEGRGEQLHLTTDEGRVEVFDTEQLLAPSVIDAVVSRLQDLKVPVVDGR